MIIVRTPLRLSFVGGGSDIKAFSLFAAQSFRFELGAWQDIFTVPLLLSFLFFLAFAEINETYRSWRGIVLGGGIEKYPADLGGDRAVFGLSGLFVEAV